MFICKYCKDNRKNNNSLINHERMCKLNTNRVLPKVDRANIKYQNQYTKAKELGNAVTITDNTRLKLSETTKLRNANESESTKEKRKNTIAEKVINGEWHTSLARKMHYVYKGIDLHGKWELAYAKWLDKNNTSWDRPSKSFPYVFEGKVRGYTPDFYLPATDEYIEIKGYKVDKDEAKWSQFPHKLTVLLKKDLKKLKII